MRTITRNGKKYRLPNEQNQFQEDMYVHLINRKWEQITKQPGKYRENDYDAILPPRFLQEFPVIYESVREMFKRHLADQPFKIHKFFNHMASSQAANANLFLPIIKSNLANRILREIKSDFGSMAHEGICPGYRIEYWDKQYNSLNDHSAIAGTDSDIAIAYYNNANPPELCLWLIEHKLTEKEFTTCNAATSKGRTSWHNCDKSIDQILAYKNTCYYHSAKGFNYWDIMSKHREFFKNDSEYKGCPFKGGENQLWRNILMGLALEDNKEAPFKHVYFSVVKHPDNTILDKTIARFKSLIDNNPMFSTFTSKDLLAAVSKVQKSGNQDAELNKWKTWYEDFYRLI